MKFILGKKIGMSQIFNEKGKVIPITLIEAGPCQITQVKDEKKDGYTAVQISFESKKDKQTNKAQQGHFKKSGAQGNFRYVKEFRTEGFKIGDQIKVGIFNPGEIVKVSGISKGKGFQGVVKRHGFHGQQKTHGNKDQERMPGSAGPTEPARVFRGKKMPGHMGDDRVTVKNLEIAKIDEENNLIYIKGAIPGARSGLIIIQGNGEL